MNGEEEGFVVRMPNVADFSSSGFSAEEKAQIRQTVGVIDDLRTKFNEFIAKASAWDGNFAAMDQVTALTQTISVSLEQLKKEVKDILEGGVDRNLKIKTDLDALTAQISDLKTVFDGQTAVPDSLSALSTKVDDLQQKLFESNQNFDLPSVKSDLEDIKKRLPAMETDVADLRQRLPVIESNIAKVCNDLNSLVTLPASMNEMKTMFAGLMQQLAAPSSVSQAQSSSVTFPKNTDVDDSSRVSPSGLDVKDTPTALPSHSQQFSSVSVTSTLPTPTQPFPSAPVPTQPSIGLNVAQSSTQLQPPFLHTSLTDQTAIGDNFRPNLLPVVSSNVPTQLPLPVGFGMSMDPNQMGLLGEIGRSQATVPTVSNQGSHMSAQVEFKPQVGAVVNPARTSPFYTPDFVLNLRSSLKTATHDPAVVSHPSVFVMKTLKPPDAFSKLDLKKESHRTFYAWLSIVENYLAMNQVPLCECSSVLYNLLQGEALAFIQMKDPHILENYYSMVNVLLDYFDMHSDSRAKRKEVEIIFMEPREKFETFVSRVRQAAYNLHGRSNPMLVEEVVRSSICLRATKPIQSFIANAEAELNRVLPIDEMVNRVRSFEALKRTRDDISASAWSAQDNDWSNRGYSQGGSKYRPRWEGAGRQAKPPADTDVQQQKFVESGDPPKSSHGFRKPDVCEKCGSQGHNAKTCLNHLPPREKRAALEAMWKLKEVMQRHPKDNTGRGDNTGDGQTYTVDDCDDVDLDVLLHTMSIQSVCHTSPLDDPSGIYCDLVDKRFVSKHRDFDIAALKRDKPDHPFTRLIVRDAPHFIATVEGHRISAFMDVGASASIIPESLFQFVLKSKSKDWIASNVINVKTNVTGYGNQRIDITEIVCLDLTIGARRKKAMFFVDKDSKDHKLLIGWSTISQYLGNIFPADIDFSVEIEDLTRLPPSQIQPSVPQSVDSLLAMGSRPISEMSTVNLAPDSSVDARIQFLVAHPCLSDQQSIGVEHRVLFDSNFCQQQLDTFPDGLLGLTILNSELVTPVPGIVNEENEPRVTVDHLSSTSLALPASDLVCKVENTEAQSVNHIAVDLDAVTQDKYGSLHICHSVCADTAVLVNGDSEHIQPVCTGSAPCLMEWELRHKVCPVGTGCTVTPMIDTLGHKVCLDSTGCALHTDSEDFGHKACPVCTTAAASSRNSTLGHKVCLESTGCALHTDTEDFGHKACPVCTSAAASSRNGTLRHKACLFCMVCASYPVERELWHKDCPVDTGCIAAPLMDTFGHKNCLNHTGCVSYLKNEDFGHKVCPVCVTAAASSRNSTLRHKVCLICTGCAPITETEEFGHKVCPVCTDCAVSSWNQKSCNKICQVTTEWTPTSVNGESWHKVCPVGTGCAVHSLKGPSDGMCKCLHTNNITPDSRTSVIAVI